MTRQETAKIMAVLMTEYGSRFCDGKAETEFAAKLNLWHTMLSDYDYAVVSAAVKAVIATSKYPPVIADITEQISAIMQPEQMEEGEAWNRVRKAISNGLYGAEEEFKKLPEECKAVVCAPEQLRAWAAMDEDELNTVVASNFRRSFRAQAERSKKYAALPSSVKSIIGNIKMLEDKA